MKKNKKLKLEFNRESIRVLKGELGGVGGGNIWTTVDSEPSSVCPRSVRTTCDVSCGPLCTFGP